MNTYAILRRNGFRDVQELEQAAARSRQAGDTVVVRPDPQAGS